MTNTLTGKVALVTGATAGIGYAIALQLAAEGAEVIVHGRNPERGAKTVQDIENAGGKARFVAADIADAADVRRLADEAGDVDILVNNAGAIPQGTITSLNDETWRRSWDLKVFGFIDITREIYAGMCKKRDGVIVNVIGGAGERPVASYIAGSMGNAALMAMSRALGAESPEYNVRVVGLNPGGTATDRAVVRLRERAAKELGDAERWQELTKKSPFGRLGTVDEVAAMVVFLCSARASYITGTIVTVDGGASSRRG